jgi:trk system potassium uptake protein TrkH
MPLRVDVRSTLSFLGTVLTYMTVPLLVPIGVALGYGESPIPFLATIGVALVVGAGLQRLHPDPDLGHREGFLFVALTWLVVPLLGAIPYLVASQGTVAHPVDALFESMSGFTTTGATVLDVISIERHGRAMLLWRQLSQWLGGMGIIVLMVAILPKLAVGGAQVMREEAPGFNVEKLTPSIRETARTLWLVYAGFTLLAFLVYLGLHLGGLAPNMGVYNAIAHALTTLPTGGFSPEPRSMEAFSSLVQWAVMPFMVVAGTNFALLWYALRGEPDRLYRNSEFRTYLGWLAVVGLVLLGLLVTGIGLARTPTGVGPILGNVEAAARHGLFQALSFVTTTGYASMDFNTWSSGTQTVLLFAMFIGGSVGSAAGSIKIVRWYVITRVVRREFTKTVHPEAVRPIRTSGEIFDEDTVSGIVAFTLLFLLLFALSTVLIFVDGVRTGLELSTLEAMSVAMATLGNIGPGFGLVGPMENFQAFSDLAKLFMVFLMWIGRLEILSVLVILTPIYWWR